MIKPHGWACDLYFLRKKAFFTENVAWPTGHLPTWDSPLQRLREGLKNTKLHMRR